jgi:hypothetical protein
MPAKKFKILVKGKDKPVVSSSIGECVNVLGFPMFYAKHYHGQSVDRVEYKTVITEAQTGLAVFMSKRLLTQETAVRQAEDRIHKFGVKTLQEHIERSKEFFERNGIPFPLNG